jgi:predicted dehydrogenase
MRLFQPDHYLSLDFLEKNAQIVRLYAQDAPDLPPQEQLMEFDTNAGKKWLQLSMPDTPPLNAIQRELEAFHEAIQNDTEPVVTLHDGFEALKLAHRILKEIAVRREKTER